MSLLFKNVEYKNIKWLTKWNNTLKLKQQQVKVLMNESLFQPSRSNGWFIQGTKQAFIFNSHVRNSLLSEYVLHYICISTYFAKKYVLVWTCMNEIQTYSNCHVTITWPTSIICVASLPFINPLLWHHGIVKCPSHAQFRSSVEVVGHLGNFAYSFSNTMNWDILLFWQTVLHLLYSKEVLDLRYSA